MLSLRLYLIACVFQSAIGDAAALVDGAAEDDLEVGDPCARLDDAEQTGSVFLKVGDVGIGVVLLGIFVLLIGVFLKLVRYRTARGEGDGVTVAVEGAVEILYDGGAVAHEDILLERHVEPRQGGRGNAAEAHQQIAVGVIHPRADILIHFQLDLIDIARKLGEFARTLYLGVDKHRKQYVGFALRQGLGLFLRFRRYRAREQFIGGHPGVERRADGLDFDIHRGVGHRALYLDLAVAEDDEVMQVGI